MKLTIDITPNQASGVATWLLARHNGEKPEVGDYRDAETVLSKIVRAYILYCDPSKPAKVMKVAVLVAQECGLQLSDLFVHTRKERIMWPRQIAMYLCAELLLLGPREIADYFGHDHGTVINACDAVAGRVRYPHYKTQVDAIYALTESALFYGHEEAVIAG